MAEEWWTIEQVQQYLGYTSARGTAVWLSRHGIRSAIHWPASEVVAERMTLKSQAARRRANVRPRPLRRNEH